MYFLFDRSRLATQRVSLTDVTTNITALTFKRYTIITQMEINVFVKNIFFQFVGLT